MAFINGKNIPFVYHTVPVPSTVRVETGSFTAQGGETVFSKRDLGFKPDVVIWCIYDNPTEPASTDTQYAIRDALSSSYYNIQYDGNFGDCSMVKPIRTFPNGFAVYPAYTSGATFGAGNAYTWMAIKSEG